MVRPLRLRARWALPIVGSPIHDAAVLTGGDGRIISVGPHLAVPTPADVLDLDLGMAILLPGLVNAHTHLELTGFPPQAEGREFRDWILGIREQKQQRTAEEFLFAARSGIHDCWAAGVTTVADTGDSGAVSLALTEFQGSGVVYQEVFGPHPEQLDESLRGLRERVQALRARSPGGRVVTGVSPHAPYTVSGPLYAHVAAWARVEGLPMAVHLAESAAETEFVARGAGPFADGWKARGIPQLDHPSHQPSHDAPRRPASPVAWLDQHGVLGPGTLCIHTVQLAPADIATLAARQVSVAHCPLSNARHRHGSAPLRALLDAGIPVGIGTDSVASVGTLDLLAEARAARALAGLSAAQTLGLCTLAGARALGLDAEIGSLTPGKWGDVAAVDAGARIDEPGFDPAERVLASSPGDVLVTTLGGRLIHTRARTA